MSDVSEGVKVPVERVQLGIRMKSMVKVLKGLAEYSNMTLGQLMEKIVLHSFEPDCTQRRVVRGITKKTLGVLADLQRIYGMDFDVHASRRFHEAEAGTSTPPCTGATAPFAELAQAAAARADPGGFERRLHPKSELGHRLGLLLRTGAHRDADDHGVGRQRLDAEHVGLVEDPDGELARAAGVLAASRITSTAASTSAS